MGPQAVTPRRPRRPPARGRHLLGPVARLGPTRTPRWQRRVKNATPQTLSAAHAGRHSRCEAPRASTSRDTRAARRRSEASRSSEKALRPPWSFPPPSPLSPSLPRARARPPPGPAGRRARRRGRRGPRRPLARPTQQRGEPGPRGQDRPRDRPQTRPPACRHRAKRGNGGSRGGRRRAPSASSAFPLPPRRDNDVALAFR